MDTRGEMGIGTLIIFIASLVVTVIAAVVVLQSAGSLQEKTYTTASQSERIVGTIAEIIEVSGTDGTKSNLTDFEILLKLAPGADEIKFTQALVTVASNDFNSVITYAGVGATTQNDYSGYFTNKAEELGHLSIWSETTFDGGLWFIGNGAWQTLGFDLDGDSLDDSLTTCGVVVNTPCPYPYNGTALRFNLTQGGIVYAPITQDDGSTGVLQSGAAGALSVSRADIGSYGYFVVRRTNANNQNQISSFDTGIEFKVYKNPQVLGSDIDDDMAADYFAINRTHALFILSSLSEPIGISLGAQLDAPRTLSVDEEIRHGGNSYGDLYISGTTTAAEIIDADVNVLITPVNEGSGKFAVKYLEVGTNHIPGNLQRGDLARVYVECPRGLHGQDTMRIQFIPKTGTPTVAEFSLPDVISRERHFLYP